MRDKILVLKRVLLVSVLFVICKGSSVYAQVGIGTNLPDINADLTLGSEDKGLLLNNVKLVSLGSASPLVLKDMIPGMLVYNTTVRGELQEGIYYWTKENKWSRMYVKTKPTRDMQFVVFKQTASEVTIKAGESRKPLPDLDYDYKAEKNGLLFLDYVIYAQLFTGKPKAGNTFCYTTVTDNTGVEVFNGITAISPYIIVNGQGKNSSFGLSSFVFEVKKGRTYSIRLSAYESYASGYTIKVGDFVYGEEAHSSMKITFMSEAEY